MNAVGITQRLVAFATAVVGHIRGRAGIRGHRDQRDHGRFLGNGTGGCQRTGSVLIPAMKRQGYHPAFAAAITAAAATIGPIIPPSIPMIIYAVVAEVSVGSLFWPV